MSSVLLCSCTYEHIRIPNQKPYILNFSEQNTPLTSFILRCMYTDKMFPFSLRDRLVPFDNQPTKDTGLVLDSLSDQNMLFTKKISPASNFKVNVSGPELTVSTDLFPARNSLQFHSCGCSPPPPALSPASLSPTHIGGSLLNQTSSPSPPVIVAEISTHSSSSSGTMPERTVRFIPKSNFCHSVSDKTIPLGNNLQFNDKSTTAPRLNALSSSSSSSSSSTSSSSILAESVEQATKGLPILEKISIALGSPRRTLGDSVLATQSKDSCVWDNNNSCVANRSQQFGQTVPDVENCVKLATSNSAETTDLIDDEKPLSLLKEGFERAPKSVDPRNPSKRGRPRKRRLPTVGTKGNKFRRGRWDSNSDSDFNNIGSNRPSRGRAVSLTFLGEQKRKAGNRRIPNSSVQTPVTVESLTNRRYLESPFLCLCQSGTMASSLADVANRFRINSSQPSDIASSDAVNITASLSAHVISPALRGISGLGFGGSQSAQLTVPPTCPLNVYQGNEQVSRDDHADHTETRTIFSGLSYRPSGLLRNRNFTSTSDNSADRSWLCAFCGKDSDFLELGGLYGPYYLADSERSQLPSVTVAQHQPHASPPKPEGGKSVLNELPAKLTRPGVITSAVTRSAAAQGRNTVANTGTLRLIIKSRNASRLPTSTCSTERPQGDVPRVCWDGEVWFHLECVLWAPGTYLIGNGTIAGLGDALQLALDSICSNCDTRGAILNCGHHGCGLRYHYLCAVRAGCLLNEEQYTLMCKKHRGNSRN